MDLSDLGEIRHQLVGRNLTTKLVSGRFKLAPTNKGKWGQCNERLLGLKNNSSHTPDLGKHGELKTIVLDRTGRFCESMKVCLTTQNPLEKLSNMVLVIARDLNGSSNLAKREVRNISVLRLRPSKHVLAKLKHDCEVLDYGKGSTHYLEIRPAGNGEGVEAYYLRETHLGVFIAEVALAREFPEVKERLCGLKITESMLKKAGYSAAHKGRYGWFVR